MPFAAVLGFLPPFCLTLLSGSGFSRVQVNQKKLQHSKRQKINCRRFGEDSALPCGLVRDGAVFCTEPPRRAVWYGRGRFPVPNLPAVRFGTAETAFLYGTSLPGRSIFRTGRRGGTAAVTNHSHYQGGHKMSSAATFTGRGTLKCSVSYYCLIKTVFA